MSRPLQNRADPFGALHAVSARGMMMGNRGGRLHTAEQTLGKRRFASRRWICCVCDFKGRQRNVWGDSYSEIFFLDEVTALAAGHRPCFECRRAEANSYAASPPEVDGHVMSADAIDRQLHDERKMISIGKRVRAKANTLPDGAMFAADGETFAVRKGVQLEWDFSGYRHHQPLTGALVDVLTPGLSLIALKNGFAPRWHPTALP